MADPQFRKDQHNRLKEPHIAPITEFVDSLSTPERWLPYVAPLHGGTEVRMLSVLRDPGSGAGREGRGSGMLSIENNDVTAETQFGLMTAAGLTPGDFIPWNSYPWYINEKPDNAQLMEGGSALFKLIDLLPNLEIVLLQGSEAQTAWSLLLEQEPSVYLRRILALETYHPSSQALISPSLEERERRRAHRATTWRAAGRLLRSK